MNYIKKHNSISELSNLQIDQLEKIVERYSPTEIRLDESAYWGHVAEIKTKLDYSPEPIRLEKNDMIFFTSLSTFRWIEIKENMIVMGF